MPEKSSNSRFTNKAIYVIAGKDEFLVNIECQKLLDRLLPPEQRAMGLFNAHPEEVTAVDIFDELRTLSLFSGRRVVLLKSADDFVSANRLMLEKYFDSPSTCGILVLVVKSWPKNTKLAKKLTKVGELINSGNLKAWQLPQYIMSYAKDKHGKVLSRLTAEALVELAGDEPAMLCCEIDKLAVFAGDDKAIKFDHIEAVIGHNRLFDAFAIVEAISAGRTAQALDRLRRTLTDKTGASYLLIGAFAFHFRRMFKAACLLEQGYSISKVASEVGVWRRQDAFFEQVRKIGFKKIAIVLGELAETDHVIKTGQMRPEAAIEQLVLRHLMFH